MAETEPTEPAPTRTERKRHVGLIFAGLMVSMLLAALDQTIFGTALPTIVGELHGIEHMQWVTTAYLAAATITLPVYGKLSDVQNPRTLLVGALGLFLVGSVLGGTSSSMTMLIIARLIQGFGGGGLMVLSQTIVADIVPPRERGRYMGAIGSMFAVSSVIGPLLGGWFTSIGWRWAFWANLPLGAVAIVIAVVFLHVPARPASGRTDVGGITTMAIAVTGLVLFTSWAGTTYAWSSPVIVLLVVITVLATIGFILVERRAAEPILPLFLLRNRDFVLATGGGLVLSVAMIGAIAYMPTYLQMVEEMTPTLAGLLMTPLTVGILITAQLSGSLVSRTGRYKTLLVTGAVVILIGQLLLATVALSTPLWLISSYLLVLGLGLGFGIQTFVLVVQVAFPDRIGVATAANNFFRQIGSSLGAAVIGTAFTVRLTGLLDGRLTGVAAPNARALTPELVRGLPAPLREIVIGAYHDALIPVYAWVVPLCAIGVIMIALLRERPIPAHDEPAAEEVADAELINEPQGA